MLHFPKISIVTPSFNQGQYIEQTILSIINQGYPKLEYIIIDGGSIDETIDIIKKYEAHITYWVSEPDKGQSDALNKGLAKCTGDIFNWINSDDLLAENSLMEIANQFINRPRTELFIGKGSIFLDDINKPLYLKQTNILSTLEETFVVGDFNQQGMFYKFSIIKDLGGINSLLTYVMDLELYFRYLIKYGSDNIFFSQTTLGHFRLHDSSKTVSLENIFQKERYALFATIIGERKSPFFYRFFIGKLKENILKKNTLDKRVLYRLLAEQEFYRIYKYKSKAVSKELFKAYSHCKHFKWNRNTISIFIKLFIINIRFRKFFNAP